MPKAAVRKGQVGSAPPASAPTTPPDPTKRRPGGRPGKRQRATWKLEKEKEAGKGGARPAAGAEPKKPRAKAQQQQQAKKKARVGKA